VNTFLRFAFVQVIVFDCVSGSFFIIWLAAIIAGIAAIGLMGH